ncbi:MAG: hypothetical protein K6E98_05270 [Lachnospiraceae bacterium]|nr:hypothetical protein [Lachnospiraceae bacterium]
MRNRYVLLICLICALVLVLFIGCSVKKINHQQKIEEIDDQVNVLFEQTEDLYTIKNLSDALLSSDAFQIISLSEVYIIRDENNEEITEQFSDNEDSIKLKSLLEKYSVIQNVYKKNDNLILVCGYLSDDGTGSYQRKIVMTKELFNESTIENYYASVVPRNYEKTISSDGIVMWKYDNGANKETIRAKKIYDDVWSFEMVREAGILSIISV